MFTRGTLSDRDDVLGSNPPSSHSAPIDYSQSFTPNSSLDLFSLPSPAMDASPSSDKDFTMSEETGDATQSSPCGRESSHTDSGAVAGRKRRKRLSCLEEGCTKQFTSEYTRKVGA